MDSRQFASGQLAYKSWMFAQIFLILKQCRWSSFQPTQKSWKQQDVPILSSVWRRRFLIFSLLSAWITKTTYGRGFVSSFYSKSHPANTTAPCCSSSCAQRGRSQKDGHVCISRRSPRAQMGWRPPKCRGLLPADEAQAHVCDRRALPRRLCSPPSHSKRMILCIVILILRNEDLAQWVLHRDHPRGEILSQNESYSWVKSTQEWFIHCGDFKAAWCRDEFQPGGGWHRLRVSLHIVPLAPLISFPLKPKCWLQEDEGEGPQLQRAPVVISHLVQREAGDCSKNLFCGSKYSS